MFEPDPTLSRWWLVPNLLALDAPLVAITWQRFLAHRFGVHVPWPATLALFTAVWCIYLLDRRLDARRGAFDTLRHRAAALRPRLFAIAALLTGSLAAASATLLPLEYVRYGAIISLGIAAYFTVVHAFEADLLARAGAKEILVAIGFSAGVAAPLAVGSRPVIGWIPSVIAFGAVCWMNCRLIDHWESGTRLARWPMAILGGIVLAGCGNVPEAVALAVAGAIAGLLLVHAAYRRTPGVARVLADIVLLTPLAFWTAP